MRKTPHYLNDERMKLYEWCGGRNRHRLQPAGPIQTHPPLHASYAVLAALTSLLILSGCDNQGSAERAGEQVGRSVQDMKEEANALFDEPAARPRPGSRKGTG